MEKTKTNNSFMEQEIISSVTMRKEANCLHTESEFINEYVRVNLDTIEYSSKPAGYEIGVISKRIVKHPTEISIEDLAKEVVKGKTFTPACFKSIGGELKRSNKYWSSQQVFALDFDEGLTLDEALKDDFFLTNATFLYTTFSHTEKHHKFRVVFALDEELTCYKEFESVMDKLLELYPYADKACKDGSRLFFGGKKVIPFNYENRLILDELIDRTPLRDIYSYINISSTPLKSIPDATYTCNGQLATNIELIISRDVFAIQDVLEIEPITLSKNEVLDYLKKQDLREFLGVEGQGNFIDIFHDEESPSASIYLSNKGTGHWLYKCHSKSHLFTGTIIHIVQRLMNCTIVEARNFLVQVYDIDIYESEAVKEFKESIDLYKSLLISDELEEIHPHFYKVFSAYGYLKDFYVLLDLTKEYVTDDSDPRIIFYHSINTLAKKFGRSTSSTGTRMNFFALFEIIRKLDEHEIPEQLLNIQKANKRTKHYQYRNSTYELPMYTYDFFYEVDELCRLWLEKGCTGRTISYEGVFRTFGKEEADRVFPQDKGKEIAGLNQDIVSQINYITLKLIEQKGWTTQQEVLDNLILYFKGQQEFKTTQFKRCIGEMLDAYDLEMVASNKKIKEEMSITEEYMSKYSFPKIIRPKKDPVLDYSPLQG